MWALQHVAKDNESSATRVWLVHCPSWQIVHLVAGRQSVESPYEASEMKGKHLFFNPFRMVGPELKVEALRLDEIHNQPVPETISLQEGLMVMSGKIIEIIRLLSKCIVSDSQKQMGTCESLTMDVRRQDEVLTAGLASLDSKADFLKGIIRFPDGLERISVMLEHILTCCRNKARNGVPFSEKAYRELDQLFAFLLDMMVNLHDAFDTPNKILLEHIISRGKKLSQMLLDFKSAHRGRLEAGFCAPHASTVYLDILESMTTINECLTSVCVTFLELGAISPADAVAPAQVQEKSAQPLNVR